MTFLNTTVKRKTTRKRSEWKPPPRL